jgi:hypothetical protein
MLVAAENMTTLIATEEMQQAMKLILKISTDNEKTLWPFTKTFD